MKKILALTLAYSVLLTACSTTQPQYVIDKKNNRSAIESIKSVQLIFDENEKYHVRDEGGSGATGLAGLLGPVGLIAAVVADTTSVVTKDSRQNKRTEEFTNAINTELVNREKLITQLVTKIQNNLKSSGKDVELSKVNFVPLLNEPLANVNSKANSLQIFDAVNKTDIPVKENVAQLFIVSVSGYAAPSATARYKPKTMVQYYLKNNGKLLMTNTIFDWEGENKYSTFASLIENRKAAYDQLGKQVNSMGDTVYKQIFDFNEVKK
jgi:hypothetical protein